ncbi:hypothetical protein [Beggiatoa leptomitoformis]|uniref:Uncharacterized protein n=1 Tax=Beggiatoa leptomitoformis TaxID=288004 RepID=A0A2N9YGE6_9GAMM|nr:hypothetical protein [Beggiatoa leptomitoformis]ALG68136.1 hypothetical protein AL038_10980 [Beggiatoa leptomitoformis]AUI69567.1 hypothetical protein BLE401_13280 [Beggiatoa leptomitoformis]
MTVPKPLIYLCLLAVGFSIFSLRTFYIHLYGSDVPIADEWVQMATDFLPWLKAEYSLDTLIAPHNGHRHALKRLVDIYWLVLNQQWNPQVSMLFNALLQSISAVFLSLLFIPYLTTRRALLLFLGGTCLLWSLPFGWENILWGFQSAWYLLILTSFITLWGLLLHPPLTRQWWLGAVAGFLVFFTQSTGLLMPVVIAIITIYQLVIEKEHRFEYLPTLVVCILLITLSWFLWVATPHLDYFKADNLSEFGLSLSRNLAFPFIQIGWFAPFFYLPFFLYLAWIIKQGKPLNKMDLLVLALGGWVLLQAIALAYGRGRFGAWAHSRYLETLAIGLIVNGFLLLYALRQTTQRLNIAVRAYALAWMTLVLGGFIHLTLKDSLLDIAAEQVVTQARATNMRTLLRTGNVKQYLDKMGAFIPGYSPMIVPALFNEPLVLKKLPVSLQYPAVVPALNTQDNIFTPTHLPPSVPAYQDEIALGSYTEQKEHATGKYISAPLQEETSYIGIPLIGSENTQGISLQLVDNHQQVFAELSAPKLTPNQWTMVYLPNSTTLFHLVVIDNSQQAWLGFAMPRAVGGVSLWAERLLQRSEWLVWGALLLLVCLYLGCLIIPKPQTQSLQA